MLLRLRRLKQNPQVDDQGDTCSPVMPPPRRRCGLRRDTGRAMSQENVEAIRAAVASGPAALLAILDDEVEWDYVGAFPEVVSYHGPQQVAEFFREWSSGFDDFGFEAKE